MDTETRIRTAYHTLASRPGAWLRHTDVRHQLTDVPAEQLDKAFRRLSLADDVDMTPESNQKTLTKEDRRNAVRVGGQDTHWIAIQARAGETRHHIGTDSGQDVYASAIQTREGHRLLYRGEYITLVLDVYGRWVDYEPERMQDPDYRHQVTWTFLAEALQAAGKTCI